ncbi:hypothetical protein MASSI9I_20169 [Massilia sp. 9I]|nr:hypothetical protein MASSI9I_20169 [Massilia sp. 9I]
MHYSVAPHITNADGEHAGSWDLPQ